ncbi:MAG: hypothetical protein KDD61_06225 [Bdellovibrionales bacterium]|nr:hypothetical protein [Bdellovibrionales bacterium]
MKYLALMLIGLFAWPDLADGMDMNKSIDSAVLEFDLGTSRLTNSQKIQVRELVQKASEMSDDTRLGVAAWSDEPFPGNEKELSDGEQDLAQARLEEVQMYVQSLNYQGSFDKFNMAKGSNWLARLFNSDSSELKSVFAKEDIGDDVLKSKYQVYKDLGAPQRVVLVLTDSQAKRAPDRDMIPMYE